MLEQPLRHTAEYQKLREALTAGRSPVALFGMPPAARAQVAAALASDLGPRGKLLRCGLHRMRPSLVRAAVCARSGILRCVRR